MACSKHSTRAGGSVMQAYGNLFQGRQNSSPTRPAATPSRPASRRASIATPPISASAPTANTTSAAARPMPPKPFHPQAARTTSHAGDPLPDTLSGFLSGSPFVYTVAIAPPYFSSGEHIGPAAISRNNCQRLCPGHMEGHAALHARLRRALGALHAHHRARASHRRISHRERHAAVCRQSAARLPDQLERLGTARAGRVAGHTANLRRMPAAASPMIPPNIWQDNFLTGSTPFAVYPRLLSASTAPIHYGFQITPSQLAARLHARRAQISLPPGNTKHRRRPTP